jgi:hypothetical protein
MTHCGVKPGFRKWQSASAPKLAPLLLEAKRQADV